MKSFAVSTVIILALGLLGSGCEYYQEQPEIYESDPQSHATPDLPAPGDEESIEEEDEVVIPSENPSTPSTTPAQSSPCLSYGAGAGQAVTTAAAAAPCLGGVGAGAAPAAAEPASPAYAPADPAGAVASLCPEPAILETSGVCRIPAGTAENCVAALADGSFYCLYGVTAYCRDLYGRLTSCSESEVCQAHPSRTGITVCSIGNNVLCRDASNAVTDCFAPVSITPQRRSKK